MRNNNILKKRFLAYIIDYLIFSFISVIIMFTIWIVFFSELVRLGVCSEEDQVTPFIFANIIMFPILIPISFLEKFISSLVMQNFEIMDNFFLDISYWFWILVFIFISFIYFSISAIFGKASIGQRQMRLKIHNKKSLFPIKALMLLRSMFKAALPFLMFIPCITIFTKSNKTIYDFILGTVVSED